MPRIFLSFRKPDSGGCDRGASTALSDRSVPKQIFKSGSRIPPGADFAGILRQQAAECELMCVLIGPGWLDARGEGGARLLDRPHDCGAVWRSRPLCGGNRRRPVLLG